MADETKEKEKPEVVEVNTLNQRKVPRKLTNSEHAIMTWHLTPEPEVSIDDMMRPEFWAHTATQLRPGHEIIVFSFDGAWRAHLCCRHVSRAAAVMGLVSFKEFGEGAEMEIEAPMYEVSWRGPSAKWGIVRKSDSQVVKDNLPSKEDAQTWIKSQMKALAA